MITLYCWNVAENRGTWLKPEELETNREELRSPNHLLWINLDNPTPEEEQRVFERFFPIHFLSLEDVTRLRREPDAPPHLPKVEEFPDYLFVIVNPLRRQVAEEMRPGQEMELPEGGACTQLSAVLTHTLLITHHYEPLSSVKDLRSYLDRHDNQAGRGPDYLFHLILDAMVDRYAPVLDTIDDDLDEYETAVFARPRRRVLERLLNIKRLVTLLRKTLVYEREVLARLCRGEFDLIEDVETVYYRNVYDHLIRFTELIETSREMVSDLMQTHLAAASNRMNEIMKVLTMISTTVLPMTLIAGIYGMNFEQLIPDTKKPWGFWIALAMMALSGLGSYLFFKWKKWG
jgi:magnesium transporter